MGRRNSANQTPTGDNDEQFQTPPGEPGMDNETSTRRGGQRGSRSGGSRTSKKDVVAADECADLLAELHSGWRMLWRQETPEKKSKDFQKLGIKLSRLTEKFSIVSLIVKTFDPLSLLLGIAREFRDEPVYWSQKRKAAKQQAAQQDVMTLDHQPTVQ